MTIASREIVNTFLNASGKNCSRAGSSHGCLRAVRNGITVVKNASLRGVPALPIPHPSLRHCAPTMRMLRTFLASADTVESVLYVLVRDSIGGETRELGLLLRSG